MEEDEVQLDRAEVPAGMPGVEKAGGPARDWEEWVELQLPGPGENVSVRNAVTGRSTRGEFPVFKQNVPNAAR